MPPSAFSKRPGLSATAPVNAPRLWPKSSDSSRVRRRHGDERPPGAAAVVVDRAGDQLLAGARLAQDEHGGGRGRDADDQLRHFLHLGVLADDEVALGLRLELPQHDRIPVLELLRSLPLGQEVPHESRARPSHHLGRWRLEIEDGPLDLGASRDVDDEIEAGVLDEPAQVRRDGNVEAARQLEAGRPGVDVGDAENRHGWITGEHLQQGPPALAGADDGDLSHARGGSAVRTAAARSGSARFSNEAYSGMKVSLMTPVGPFRCLPMMTSAMRSSSSFWRP